MESVFLRPPVASTLLGSLLDDPAGKPRNRSEWEDRFLHWQRPASETEEQKIETASSRVRQALANSSFLKSRNWSIVPQGSYHNNTNVRTDSDVDLCVCLDDIYHFDSAPHNYPMQELGLVPLDFTFGSYKEHIAQCMRDEFGAGAVTVGGKAVHLNKDHATHISVDVVPAYTYRRYGARQTVLGDPPVLQTGVAICTSEGEWRTNFPRQHYLNGCAKTENTGRRYKRVVRILKRIRNHIRDNSFANQDIKRASGSAASFLIESLVYNCPDHVFGNNVIYDDVVAVLKYLDSSFGGTGLAQTMLGLGCYGFKEVNGIKDLFRQDQAWTVQDAHAFVLGARLYMGV